MSELPEVPALLDAVAADLRRLLAEREHREPVMVGIRTGGVWVARHLHQALAIIEPLGTLNINFYRDDFTRIGLHPRVEPSNLPFDVADRHIVLVDDVLHTGRTIRAALNELFDYGRPKSVTLVTLVVRPGRELPIQADVCGMDLDLAPGELIKLTGPHPMALVVQAAP